MLLQLFHGAIPDPGALFDTDGDGFVTFQEFLVGMMLSLLLFNVDHEATSDADITALMVGAGVLSSCTSQLGLQSYRLLEPQVCHAVMRSLQNLHALTQGCLTCLWWRHSGEACVLWPFLSLGVAVPAVPPSLLPFPLPSFERVHPPAMSHPTVQPG